MVIRSKDWSVDRSSKSCVSNVACGSRLRARAMLDGSGSIPTRVVQCGDNRCNSRPSPQPTSSAASPERPAICRNIQG